MTLRPQGRPGRSGAGSCRGAPRARRTEPRVAGRGVALCASTGRDGTGSGRRTRRGVFEVETGHTPGPSRTRPASGEGFAESRPGGGRCTGGGSGSRGIRFAPLPLCLRVVVRSLLSAERARGRLRRTGSAGGRRGEGRGAAPETPPIRGARRPWPPVTDHALPRACGRRPPRQCTTNPRAGRAERAALAGLARRSVAPGPLRRRHPDPGPAPARTPPLPLRRPLVAPRASGRPRRRTAPYPERPPARPPPRRGHPSPPPPWHGPHLGSPRSLGLGVGALSRRKAPGRAPVYSGSRPGARDKSGVQPPETRPVGHGRGPPVTAGPLAGSRMNDPRSQPRDVELLASGGSSDSTPGARTHERRGTERQGRGSTFFHEGPMTPDAVGVVPESPLQLDTTGASLRGPWSTNNGVPREEDETFETVQVTPSGIRTHRQM